MSEPWTPLPLDQPLYRNIDPAAVMGFQTAIENGFQTEAGGISRFPGLAEWAKLDDNGRVYLFDWNNDLIASTSKGRTYRISRTGKVRDVTGIPLAGGRRTIFTKSDRELMMAAGRKPLRLRDEKTELLGRDFPDTTHIQWLDNYTLLAETDSGRFYHTPAGEPDTLDPIDTFSADGSPDNINGMIVTPFRELLLTGAESIEQFERSGDATVPFARRFAIGDGVSAPYAAVFADNAVWVVNALKEFVRLSGQVSTSESRQIGRMLERIDDWSDCWMGGFPNKPLHVEGQKFILLQCPKATNAYGTKGVTLVFDYAQRKWFELYGWSDDGIPDRWPGWSHWTMWDEVFVGGEGRIYKLTRDAFTLAGQTQRFLVRTGIIAANDSLHVKNMRLQIKRGMGGPDTEAFISVRCSRNGRPFGNNIRRSLGRMGQNTPFIEFGQFGQGHSFQFEIFVTADVDVEIVKAEAKMDYLGH